MTLVRGTLAGLIAGLVTGIALAALLLVASAIMTTGGLGHTPLFLIVFAMGGAMFGAVVGALATLVAMQFAHQDGTATRARLTGAGTAALVSVMLGQGAAAVFGEASALVFTGVLTVVAFAAMYVLLPKILRASDPVGPNAYGQVQPARGLAPPRRLLVSVVSAGLGFFLAANLGGSAIDVAGGSRLAADIGALVCAVIGASVAGIAAWLLLSRS